MSSSVDPDQTAPLGEVLSGSTLFAQIYVSQYLEFLQYILNLMEQAFFLLTL